MLKISDRTPQNLTGGNRGSRGTAVAKLAEPGGRVPVAAFEPSENVDGSRKRGCVGGEPRGSGIACKHGSYPGVWPVGASLLAMDSVDRRTGFLATPSPITPPLPDVGRVFTPDSRLTVRPPSSALRLPPSVLCPPPSVLRLPSSIFALQLFRLSVLQPFPSGPNRVSPRLPASPNWDFEKPNSGPLLGGIVSWVTLPGSPNWR